MDKTIFKNRDLKKSQQSKAKESRKKKINKASLKKEKNDRPSAKLFFKKKNKAKFPKMSLTDEEQLSKTQNKNHTQ